MDHLPLPSSPRKLPFRLPYLCAGGTVVCDLDGFPNFPQQKGWNIDPQNAKHEDKIADLGEEFAAFLQSWLYFGMLSAVTGEHINVGAFKHGSDASRLDSSPLKDIVPQWSNSIKSDSKYGHERALREWVEKVTSCLKIAGRFRHVKCDPENERYEDLINRVLIAITVLVETLYGAVEQICCYKKEQRKGPDVTSSLEWAYTCRQRETKHDRARPLLKMLRKKGWCKRDLFCLDAQAQNLGISNLWFYANMWPPRHGYSHKDCSRRTCRYDYVFDQDSYKVAHISGDSDCQCKLIGPPPEALKEIIESGHFPLISFTHSGEVKVHRSDSVREFVAISHVWSGGTGNPHANTMSTCFLRYLSWCVDRVLGAEQAPLEPGNLSQFYNAVSYQLQQRLNLRHDPKPFWIDTLCIPRYPQELRSKALSRMREPFEQATIVLTMDRSLSGVLTRDMSYIEMFARLRISNWAKRLWTYHEDVVGSNNYVQFNERSVDVLRQGFPLHRAWDTLSDPLDKYKRSRVHGGSSGVTSSSLGSTFKAAFNESKQPVNGIVASLRRYGLNPHDRVGAGIHWYRYMLETKSTSNESDQALCLASMMGLDMQAVASAAGNDRMRIFWSLVQSLPVGILFSKSERKLNYEGFRWAPASFLEVNDYWMGPKDLHQEYISRSVGDTTGLRVKLPAIFLKCWNSLRDGNMSGSSSIKTILKRIEGEGHAPRFFDKKGTGWNIDFEEEWHQGSKSLDDPNGLAILLEPYSIKAATSFWGILVSYKQQDGYIQACAHRHVTVKKVSSSLPRLAQGFEACTRDILSHYDSDFLGQLLWVPKKSNEPDRVVEAQRHLKEFLKKQDGFIEEDRAFWREYYDETDGYSGDDFKERARMDTVVMWCLLWPNVRAQFSNDRLEFCVD